MRNRRSILLGIFYVLFAAAVAFGQDQSDPNIITVTEKIDVAKLNENVENLTKSVADLTKTVEKLGTTVETLNTTVDELKITVARIDERTQGTAKVQHVILGSIIAPLVVAIIAPIVYYILTQKIMNKRSKDTTKSTQTVQENQSEAASMNPTQANERETISTPTAPSRFSKEAEVTEYLKSDSLATKVKI